MRGGGGGELEEKIKEEHKTRKNVEFNYDWFLP